MRVLYVTTRRRTGARLAEALAADSASRVELEEVVGSAAGASRLREEVYDALLVSHDPSELDALDLLEGLRAGEAELPAIVLGTSDDSDMQPLCFEVGGDAYLCVDGCSVRTLIWALGRAIERRQLIREHRRLAQAERQRMQQEHQEVERFLEQQRALIGDLEALRRGAALTMDATGEAIFDDDSEAAPTVSEPKFAPPARLVSLYQELLRAYVIMGSGNLVSEIKELVAMLVAAGVSADQTLELHLQVLEELIRGLGSRSTRHVMTRGDLMCLEVMIHLAEGYRQQQRTAGLQQPPGSPGFERARRVAA